jgi:hypothetical protein
MAASFVVVFAIYPRVTQLDFTGPHEVLWRLPGARCIARVVRGRRRRGGRRDRLLAASAHRRRSSAAT